VHFQKWLSLFAQDRTCINVEIHDQSPVIHFAALQVIYVSTFIVCKDRDLHTVD